LSWQILGKSVQNSREKIEKDTEISKNIEKGNKN
jgi:hypothetical protein